MPTALITGSGSGIGRAIAITLARMGYTCVLVGRRADALHQTAAMLARPSHIITADLTQAADASRIVDDCLKRTGSLHVLVNNAGWSPACDIATTSEADIAQVFSLNAVAPAITLARAWTSFAKQHAAGEHGMCVINISSLGTIDPFDTLWAYASAKASVNLLALSIARQGKAIGVRGFTIAPGAVETDLLRSIVPQSMLPPEDTLLPQEVADLVAACIKGDRDADNGKTIFIDKRLGIFLHPSQ